MIIHQAFFGDSNGSHNVLATTFQNKNLIGKLKSITDNPAGISVDYAYLSGYLIEDFYIFCKTMTDTTAKRGGMVFSHCLMIPKTKLSELNNLVVVFEHFAKEPIK